MNYEAALAYLNVVGLVAGVVGGVLTCVFGLPNLDVLNEAAYSQTLETPRILRYKCFSRLGLGLITIGFAMQLLPAIHALPT